MAFYWTDEEIVLRSEGESVRLLERQESIYVCLRISVQFNIRISSESMCTNIVILESIEMKKFDVCQSLRIIILG